MEASSDDRGNRNDSDENGASMEIMALKAEVNDMGLDFDNLHERKSSSSSQMSETRSSMLKAWQRWKI